MISVRKMGMGVMHKRIIAVIFCIITLLSVAIAQPSNKNVSYSKNPKFESILSQLISSDNPQDFAKNHNLFMKNGRIRVMIELSDETALPDYIIEETRYEKNVQIMVPIEKLEELSMETNVIFIRTPSKPYADTIMATPDVQKTIPKSGFNSTIPFIISIVLIFLIGKKRSSSIVKK